MRAVNYRHDPFSDTMQDVAITNELHRIPVTGPYVIKLREVPLKEDPSTLTMRVRCILMAAVTTTSGTSILVDYPAWMVNGDILTVDSEQMQVTDAAAGTVTRGYGGTTATTHTAETPVYIEDSMEEVATTPAAGQYLPDYSTAADDDADWNIGQIEHNATDAGKIVAVNYQKTGAVADDRVVKVAMPDHIVEGMEVELGTGLEVTVNIGSAWVSNELVEMEEAIDLYLQAKRAQLVYIGLEGFPIKQNAAFPVADAGTVCRWIVDGAATIASTVGSNALTKSGTITQVNGWANDYAGQGDGSTGSYTSANSTGFPTGTDTKECVCVFTPKTSAAGNNWVWVYGNAQLFGLAFASLKLWLYINASWIDTGYLMELDKKYGVSVQNSGTTIDVFVNGMKVFSTTATVAVDAGVLCLFKSLGVEYGNVVIDYVEIRNALRTPAQIAAISNALLLPCQHSGEAIIPAMTSNTAPSGTASASAEYSATYAAWKAMDGNETTYWQPSASGATGTLQYAAIMAGVAKAYTVKGGNTYYPTAWEFKGSNDGAEWTILDAKTGQNTASSRTYHISNTETFSYYQLNVTASAGAGLQVITFQVDIASADITAVLPADTHPLAFTWTDADNVIEKDDHSYKYGIRKGIAGGNREELLGWQFFSGAATLKWPNPFGGRKVDAVYKWAESRDGRNESDVFMNFNDSDNTGVKLAPTASAPFCVTIGSSGAAYFNGAWKTSGYIGCYGRVIEDE